MDKNSYGYRLQLAMDMAKASRKDLAGALGVSVQAVGDVIRGKSSAFTAENNAKAAQYLGVNPNWLATGHGQMESPVEGTTTYLLTPGAKASNPALASMLRAGRAIELIDLENNQDYPAIRRVNITAKAGVTGYAVDFIDEERPPIFFRRDWYESKGYRPDRMIAIRVSGDSMIPSLFDGDLIVINTEQKQPKQGIAFLVSFEGEVVVKRLVRDDGQWWLTSDNPDQRRYPRVKCNGGTEIIGEVVYRQTEQI